MANNANIKTNIKEFLNGGNAQTVLETKKTKNNRHTLDCYSIYCAIIEMQKFPSWSESIQIAKRLNTAEYKVREVSKALFMLNWKPAIPSNP